MTMVELVVLLRGICFTCDIVSYCLLLIKWLQMNYLPCDFGEIYSKYNQIEAHNLLHLFNIDRKLILMILIVYNSIHVLINIKLYILLL